MTQRNILFALVVLVVLVLAVVLINQSMKLFSKPVPQEVVPIRDVGRIPTPYPL